MLTKEVRFLLGVMIVAESGGYREAVRFEPAFFERLREGNIHEEEEHFRRGVDMYISLDTVRAIMATSWGLLQILGYNLIYQDWRLGRIENYTRFWEYATNERRQAEYFKWWAERNNIDLHKVGVDLMHLRKSEELYKFAEKWNGSKKYAFTLLNIAHGEDKDELLREGRKIYRWLFILSGKT